MRKQGELGYDRCRTAFLDEWVDRRFTRVGKFDPRIWWSAEVLQIVSLHMALASSALPTTSL